MRLLGLDEAGRGCVLGPLVVRGFLFEDANDAPLQAAGAADSKALSKKRRESAKTKLTPLGTPVLRFVTARQIDAENINTLEEKAFASIIAEARPDKVIIDAPVHPRGIPAFIKRLHGRLSELRVPLPEIVAEPKADANYPVVGAASIFAKVARDAEIEALGPVGSGYPSDPVTRKWISGFLARNEPFPSCVRTRWGTIDALRQATLFG